MDEGPLHRRADLHHIMAEHPGGEVGNAQILGPDHPVERLALQVQTEALRGLVGDQGHQFPVRMEAAQGLVEDPGPVQVAEGEAGIDHHLHDARSGRRSTVRAL